MITPDDLQTPEDDNKLTHRRSFRRPKRGGRRPQPRIVDPENHPREDVCLSVAADFLRLDKRTVIARIEDGALDAKRDGNVYRIPVSALAAYRAKFG